MKVSPSMRSEGLILSAHAGGGGRRVAAGSRFGLVFAVLLLAGLLVLGFQWSHVIAVVLAAAIGLGLSLVVPNAGFGLLIMVLPWAGVASSTDAAPFWFDYLVVVALVGGAFARVVVSGRLVGWRRLIVLAVLLFAFAILVLLGELNNDFRGIGRYLIFVLAIASFFASYSMVSGSMIRSSELVIAAAVGLVVLVLLSIVEFGINPYRLDLFGNVRPIANQAALVLFGILVALAVTKSEGMNRELRGGRGWLLVYVISLLLLASVVFATVSRGVLVAILVAALVFVLAESGRKRFLSILVLAGAGMGLVWMLPHIVDMGFLQSRVQDRVSDPTADPRFLIWKDWLGVFLNDSSWGLVGIGVGARHHPELDMYAHSLFLDSLVGAGVVGAVLFGVFLLVVGRTVMRSRVPGLGAVFVGLLTLFFSHGQLISVTFWLVMGVVFAVAHNGCSRTTGGVGGASRETGFRSDMLAGAFGSSGPALSISKPSCRRI